MPKIPPRRTAPKMPVVRKLNNPAALRQARLRRALELLR